MHIPDGFLTAPLWGGLGAASMASIAVVARSTRLSVEESRIPLMGVMGAFVFAAQMVNFPVGVGASGHLVGGALLAVTLGPAAASIVLTAVLAIQALVFQDGGLLALGANVFNMAIAGVAAAWLPYRALEQSRRKLGVFLAGFCSVFVSASLCLGELGLSGVHLTGAPLGVALLVFLVTATLEGAITVAVVGALEKINPRWRHAGTPHSRPMLSFLMAAALLIASCGFMVASSLPDGLEHFAEAMDITGREFSLFTAPLPDYEALNVASPWLRKALAGLTGLTLTTLVCFLLGRWLIRPRNEPS